MAVYVILAGMNVKRFLVRSTAVVLSAALGAVVSPALDISIWQGALAAASVPAITILKKLLDALKDGSLTEEEADSIIEDAK